MANNSNKGLGRGLSALLDINDIDMKADEGYDSLEVDINRVFPNKEQPRKTFDESALRELAESVKQHGVIQPLILTKRGDDFLIIAGERRYRAALLAGLRSVPAIVRDYDDRKIREIALIENLQREDLNPIEAAVALKSLITDYGLTQEEAADRIGKSRSGITNTLRLLTLQSDVIEMVKNNQLSAGHARALVVVSDPDAQLKMAKKAVAEGLSVRAVENMVKLFLNPPEPVEKRKTENSIELKTLVDDMQRVFATKVSAVSNGEKGRIYIDFFSKDDLDRIVEIIDDWKEDNFIPTV
ncbi:MAG: ParB/RepB/Spo0J family partition protein [Clostridia bacterium]|nr:ParB/RepB/Spo0J family partition protein [Clostridia bacterium]